MNFRVDKSIGLTTDSRSLRINAPDTERTKLAASINQPVTDTTSVATDKPQQSSPLLLASNAKSFYDVAAQAAAQITALRETQLAYAEEAEDTANRKAQASYATEINSIESEINRIYNGATYNGQNTLTGAGFNIDSEELGIDTSIQAASLSYLTNNPGVTVTTQSAATTAVSTLEAIVSASRTGSTGIQAALSKAETTLSDSLREASAQRQADGGPEDIADAEKLTQNIVNELQAKFGSGDLTAEIVTSNLDPQRVSSLLEE
ncbi:MAG: hypothetical protein K1X83_07215 [Oligoflexia bacterium]|nr:hypothetical protein [Oligoflexia bacterium]